MEPSVYISHVIAPVDENTLSNSVCPDAAFQTERSVQGDAEFRFEGLTVSVGALQPADWTHKLNLVMYYSFHFQLCYLCGAG